MIHSLAVLGLCATLAAANHAPFPTPHLHARAPTGSPALTAINANYTTEATSTLPTSVAPGATPVPNAPAIPPAALVVADFPALDVVPPTDSDQVKQWLAEYDLANIPNIQPNGLGGCQNTTVNAQAIAQASASGNCWWTCGGCTRQTDITFCPKKGDWGLSYDDGPSPYTPRLLDYLSANKLLSTFFVVGSRVLSRPNILQSAYALGHQICVHTWSHPYLTTLTNEQIVAELGWTMLVIKKTLGVTPNCMRPPYGDIDDRVRYISLKMGLTPIIWTSYQNFTYDTRDWQIAGGTVTSTVVLQNFEAILTANIPTGFIVLQHDLYLQSVTLALEYVLPSALANSSLTLMPINQCLGQSTADSYIETSSNKSSSQAQVSGASGSGAVPGITSPTAGSTGTSGTSGGTSSGAKSGAVSINIPAGLRLVLAVMVMSTAVLI